MARTYDVIVLGTGNAGMAAARVTRQAGLRVAIVEAREEVGGTCALRGCVPKKVLVAAAETFDAVSDAARHGIVAGAPRVDWPALIDRERSFVEGTSEAFAETLRRRGIELVHGRAKFRGRNEVEVAGERLSAGKVVIATGSLPRPLPFDGAEYLIDNEDILRERELPKSVVFVGGGVIALEFSHVYARAGCEVTILENAPRILGSADTDAAARIGERTEALGIRVRTGIEVKSVAREGGGFSVHFGNNGERQSLYAERVAHGAGRIPAVEALMLDAGGIEHDGPKIALTEHLASTSNADVYVAGDAHAGAAQLSPLATYEGEVVARNILDGNTTVPDYRPVPSVLFAVPPLASVGLNEAEAEAQGLDVAIDQTDMSEWFAARLYGSESAYAKVLTEKRSRRIVGAHLVGKRAEEMIHLFAFAMKFGVSADQMAKLVYAFPTSSSEVKSLVARRE